LPICRLVVVIFYKETKVVETISKLCKVVRDKGFKRVYNLLLYPKRIDDRFFKVYF